MSSESFQFSDDDFIRGLQSGFLEAVAFTDTENPDYPEYEDKEISPLTRAYFDAECERFYHAHKGTLQECGIHPDRCGHDFWLTRNGHGAGFWDRGLGDAGEALTKACGHGTDFPEINLYVSDDGAIEVDHLPDTGVGFSANWLEITSFGASIKLEVPSAAGRYEVLYALQYSGRTENQLWYDLLEPFFTNGEWTPVDPESHYVGLTADPYILGEELVLEDNGDLTSYGGVYHYPDYQVNSVLELLGEGRVVWFDRFMDGKNRIHAQHNLGLARAAGKVHGS